MKVKIYVAAHKRYNVIDVPGYIPIQVGAAINEKLPYLADDTGDNISAENLYFSELTATYWFWKNDTESDILGLNHYRRYFPGKKGRVLTTDEIEDILKDYDVIVTSLNSLPEGNTIRSAYEELHEPADVIAAEKSIKTLYPEYIDAFCDVMDGNDTYICNMIIAKRETMDAYLSWLFGVLFEMKKYIDPSKYDNYSRRSYALMAERLETVWIRHNGIKAYEATPICTEEKTETRETREAGEKLVKEGRLDDLLPLMQKAHDDRPDMFLWTSDITDRLSDLLTIGRIYGAEDAANIKHSGCFGTMSVEKLYSFIDRLKDILNNEKACRLIPLTSIIPKKLRYLLVISSRVNMLPFSFMNQPFYKQSNPSAQNKYQKNQYCDYLLHVFSSLTPYDSQPLIH